MKQTGPCGSTCGHCASARREPRDTQPNIKKLDNRESRANPVSIYGTDSDISWPNFSKLSCGATEKIPPPPPSLRAHHTHALHLHNDLSSGEPTSYHPGFTTTNAALHSRRTALSDPLRQETSQEHTSSGLHTPDPTLHTKAENDARLAAGNRIPPRPSHHQSRKNITTCPPSEYYSHDSCKPSRTGSCLWAKGASLTSGKTLLSERSKILCSNVLHSG